MTASRRSTLPFDRLGDYEILAPISEGGMASVWLGKPRAGGGHVALKVIRADHGRNREFVAMFLDEARIASRLAHPNVIAIHGLGHDGTRHFLAMEVLRGHTLLEVWDAAKVQKRALPREVIAWIGARIADGLHHAHELTDDDGRHAQVVHRDVNPANVFLTRDGIPKLIDFGLAKARDRVTSTAVGIIKGKLAYLAPEQAHGAPIDRRVDIFALGVTLWELTLDRRLFKETDDVETLRRVRESNVPDPTTIDATVPPELARVLLRALARDPRERYATAAELRDALDGSLAHGPPVDAATVRELLDGLFTGHGPAPWERFIEGDRRVRLESRDVEEDKRTRIHIPLHDAAPPPAEAPTQAVPGTRRERLEAALAERLEALRETGEPLALARIRLELAAVDEALGDATRATAHATASLEAYATPAAHGILRRLSAPREEGWSRVDHVDAEIAACTSEGTRADLLAERARLLEAAGATADAVRAAWERALEVRPDLPAALRGLDAALSQLPDARDARAAHLARMAEAYAVESKLAAWLLVERAELLAELGRPEDAKSALLRAREIDPRPGGAVHAACAAHAAVHRDAEWLVHLLGEEAAAESDPARAAALALDAACVARYRLGDGDRAAALLGLAASGAAEGSAVQRRVLEELASRHEAGGRTGDALHARRALLATLHEPDARAHELRTIAALQEAAGERDQAIASLEAAIDLAPDDAGAAEALDRLLRVSGRAELRADLWARLASRAHDGPSRAAAWMRASRAAEDAGLVDRAVLHARAALVAHAGHPAATDALLRLFHAPLPEEAVSAARARIAVHAHAAENPGDVALGAERPSRSSGERPAFGPSERGTFGGAERPSEAAARTSMEIARDLGRRVFHLTACALLQEEVLGDAPLALSTYEAIVRLDPKHAGALAGVVRMAARCGDVARRAEGLVAEAKACADPRVADAKRAEAAEILAPIDPDRALAWIDDVLKRRSSHADALRTAQRLHEAAERWSRVDATLAARIEATEGVAERVHLWLARAEVQRAKLRSPRDALASVRAALALAPSDPGARAALERSVDAIADPATQLQALEDLARSAPHPADKARGLAWAADVAEHRVGDDVRTVSLYAQALRETPGDPWLEERALRVLRRAAAAGDTKGLERALAARVERVPEDQAAVFELASLRLSRGDAERALEPAAALVNRDDRAPHALRLLERAARASGDASGLHRALRAQARAFATPAAEIGASWALVATAETSEQLDEVTAATERILADAPQDRAAMDAFIRAAWPRVRQGDLELRRKLVAVLDARAEPSSDDGERLWTLLVKTLVLGDDDPPAALAAARAALEIDGASVIAAQETARLGSALGDAEACIAGALARATLATSERGKATLLVQAAGQVLGASDARLGPRADRLARAGALLERALVHDPEAISAVALLAAVRAEDGSRDRLVASLRDAFSRATSPHVVATLGLELARVASREPADRVLAIEALRRVIALEPDHAPTWRALAEQYAAQGACAEAAEALEAFVARAREANGRISALFELADLYAALPGRSADVSRVLEEALEVDPTRVTALHRLMALRRAAGAPGAEIADLYARLAEAETSPDAKADALVRLAELRRAAGDTAGAEQALIEANAQGSSPARLAALNALHEGDAEAQASALSAVVARSKAIGRLDAACHAALGKLEGAALGRWADATTRLRAALALAPAMHEARTALAEALVRTGAAPEASTLVLSMITPDAAPLAALSDPASALGTLERALDAQGRPDEAMVARELRALAGSLAEVEYRELRARRLGHDHTSTPAGSTLDATALRQHVVPREVPSVCFEIATALLGVERRLVRTTLEDVRADPRERLPASSGHPLVWIAHRLATALGVARPEIVTVASLARPRVVSASDALWLAVPHALLAHPEPVQCASVAGALVRIALGVPWLEDTPPAHTRALLCAAVRQVVPGYGLAPSGAGSHSAGSGQAVGGGHATGANSDAESRELSEDAARHMARILGRAQKRALAAIAPSLASQPAPSLNDVEAFAESITLGEARAAFVLTGDYLATLDTIRAVDKDLAASTAVHSSLALRASLLHPLAGDVARFALSPQTTVLRWRAGTLWSAPRASG